MATKIDHEFAILLSYWIALLGRWRRLTLGFTLLIQLEVKINILTICRGLSFCLVIKTVFILNFETKNTRLILNIASFVSTYVCIERFIIWQLAFIVFVFHFDIVDYAVEIYSLIAHSFFFQKQIAIPNVRFRIFYELSSLFICFEQLF